MQLPIDGGIPQQRRRETTARASQSLALDNARDAAASANPKLSCRDLAVHYSGKRALAPVSLDFPGRSVTALIGPSGCGKTTLLRALNRMHDLVQGTQVYGKVFLEGNDIYSADIDPVGVRRRSGMVFQKPAPFPKSIFDNVAFGLRVSGFKGQEEIRLRVEHALRQAALFDEVADRLGDSANSLSGGQQQRLCIARALAVSPEVLLMDEPTSALDPYATAHIEHLIRELARDYTIVVVTHNMQQAARVSAHTAFLYLGELVEFDATETIFGCAREGRTRAYIAGRFG
jgi:phosphate transport system ATP-binding protein